MSLTSSSYDDLERIWGKIAEDVAARPSLQGAADVFLDAFHAQFADELILSRVFATSEFGGLPAIDQAFVRAAAHSAGVLEKLEQSTNVLSLLATRGREAAWNEREKSASHLGIPLISEQFVQEIPMIVRLLGETGFDPNWYGLPSSNFVTPSFANVNGLFYVEEAKMARDELGRRIIPAQDFVSRYGVRSVFGIGGTYVSQSMFLAITFFCATHVTRQQAMKFLPLVSLFKAASTRAITRRAIFE